MKVQLGVGMLGQKVSQKSSNDKKTNIVQREVQWGTKPACDMSNNQHIKLSKEFTGLGFRVKNSSW